MGFEPVTSANTGAMLYQLSYEATHWERGQFIEFISPVRSEVMRSIYEIIHISELRLQIKVKNDQRRKHELFHIYTSQSLLMGDMNSTH